MADNQVIPWPMRRSILGELGTLGVVDTEIPDCSRCPARDTYCVNSSIRPCKSASSYTEFIRRITENENM